MSLMVGDLRTSNRQGQSESACRTTQSECFVKDGGLGGHAAPGSRIAAIDLEAMRPPISPDLS